MYLKDKIKQMRFDLPDGIELYLFGSTTYIDNYSDIDIALIYNKKIIPLEDASIIRQQIKKQVTNQFNLFCDILALSTDEEKETEFLYNAKTEKIN